jgi:hypothetical protein
MTGPDHRHRETQGAFHRSAALVQVFRISWRELVDLPPTDPVVVDLPPQRCIKVAHDDPNLHCLVCPSWQISR